MQYGRSPPRLLAHGAARGDEAAAHVGLVQADVLQAALAGPFDREPGAHGLDLVDARKLGRLLGARHDAVQGEQQPVSDPIRRAQNLVSGRAHRWPRGHERPGHENAIDQRAVRHAAVEGVAVLDQVLGSAATSLPRQIAIELHLRTHPWRNVSGFDGAGLLRGDSGHILKHLRARLERAGYALIDRNDNPWCRHCSEVLFVHT